MVFIRQSDIPAEERHLIPFSQPRIRSGRRRKRKSRRRVACAKPPKSQSATTA